MYKTYYFIFMKREQMNITTKTFEVTRCNISVFQAKDEKIAYNNSKHP
jgi:hypothetical protein